MVAGHLQEKNGIYYAVLSYKDPAGKRKQPWISTGVPVRKGNKKKAEQELQKLRREYVAPAQAAGFGPGGAGSYGGFFEKRSLIPDRNKIESASQLS